MNRDEQELIDCAKQGDENAFGDLVQMYHVRLAGLLYRLVGRADMVDELEQQVWIKVWKALPRFKEQSAFFSWLYTIATRTALDHRRKQARKQEVSYLDERDHAGGTRPDREMMGRETGVQIKEALEKLREKHRTVLVLREMEGLSYEDIADVTGCRVGTVMSRLHHARRQMRDLLMEARA